MDGSRVKLIIPPESTEPYIIIRKHNLASASLDELALMGLELPINTIKEPAIKKISKNETENLIEIGQNQDIREYCKQAIIQRKNIVFVGDTGAGKTTFMNSLTYYIQKIT
ncbi:type II/IV secretion system family protein (plasmid) [Clostridium botulinum]|uniref:Type II/IV secretion system family protein n=1 Tax=Clostridium botulinum TaxID=1491 RepID=A0A1L7JN86_CLOBO|nr:ATPase, T2SS/T4P/T4SS family [Clostridium botulinum]APU87176.1 type II/IV secretion system family protein [Clostridium botulinum]